MSLLLPSYSVAHSPINLGRPEAVIKDAILSEAPLGSTIAQVENVIRQHNWKLRYPLADTGFYDQRTRPAKIVGSKHFRASLGDYGWPFDTNVTAFWGFDVNDRLIDIWIWKTTDGF